MFVVVSDASVLIDIEIGELTSAMFSLPFQFIVPDVLFSEELYEKHRHLLELGLLSKSMSGELISEAYALRQEYAKPSVNDLLALVLAKSEACQLLTGDKALKKVAERFHVEVHGTVWLVKKMLSCKKITVEVARVAFKRMKDSGSHLPWGKVDELLEEK